MAMPAGQIVRRISTITARANVCTDPTTRARCRGQRARPALKASHGRLASKISSKKLGNIP
jgi:hypothetical protein